MCSNERTRDAHENALLLLFVGRLVVLAGKLDAPVTDENTARVAAVANNDVCWRNEGSSGRASAAIRATRQPANEISITIRMVMPVYQTGDADEARGQARTVRLSSPRPAAAGSAQNAR